ncbi:MAG: hypothetical protein SFU86_14040 [Pirellulaceae bacterium]|nr:hypothetical protein [Pirellulaceae bacterium]
MDNPLLFQILLVLVGLFFIFLTYMNTKTWRWLHVMFTFLVFGASIAFTVYASLTLKTRAAWISYHDKMEKDSIQAKKDLELVTIGDPADATKPSIVNYREDISRAILDRGRVWKDNTVAPAGGSFNITLAPAPADPVTGAAGPPRKHNLAVSDIVFAFKNGQSVEGFNVPLFYLGEFRVTALADDTNFTIAPVLPLSAEQAAAANDPAGIWTLYEISPIDGREWFADLDKAALQALLPQSATGITDPVKYDKLLDQYLRDGQPADEATDPPDNIWYEVKFKQAHSVPVDAVAVTAPDANPFNTDGQAQRDQYRKAKPGEAPAVVDFEPGNTGIFDKETADSLIQQGLADKVQPIFRRRLNDYELKFHEIHERIVEIDDRLRVMALDLAAIQAAEAKAKEQEALQTEYKGKLIADIAKIKFERDSVEKYRVALEARLAAVKGEIRALYLSNVALSREMAALNAKLTDEINRRTAEATALNQ